MQDTASEARVQALTRELEVARSNVRVERVWVRRPDGTSEAREVSESREESRREVTADTTTASTETTHTEAAREAVRVVERTAVRPDWSVTALVGAQPGWPLVPVYGGAVERRLVGGLWLGAWGHSGGPAGTYGLQARLEW